MTDETRLTDELTRRAESVHSPAIAVADVRSRAQGIRRRRRIAMAAGVAAAVALVIVVPTLLTGGQTRSDGVDPARPPAGQGASVLHDSVVTLPGGDQVPIDVDNADVSSFGVLTDGRIVVARTNPNTLQVFGPDGTLTAEHSIGTTLVRVSPLGDAAAWMEGDGTIQVLASGAEEPVELGRVETGRQTYPLIDAVLDRDHVLVSDGNTTNLEVTPDGATPLTTSDPLLVTDVPADGSLWAVQYADDSDPQFGCSGLYDPEADTMVARTCDTSHLTFAPDGQHLLGMRGDNNMADHVDILDLALRDVGSYTPDGKTAVVSRAAWADAAHLQVSVANYASNRWWLARDDIDGGEPEVVVPPFDGRNPEITPEFIFSE